MLFYLVACSLKQASNKITISDNRIKVDARETSDTEDNGQPGVHHGQTAGGRADARPASSQCAGRGRNAFRGVEDEDHPAKLPFGWKSMGSFTCTSMLSITATKAIMLPKVTTRIINVTLTRRTLEAKGTNFVTLFAIYVYESLHF